MIDFGTVVRIAAAFAVVAGMLAVFAAVARSGMRGPLLPGREKLVSVIETTPLPHAGSLHVIRVGERYHVIGLTSGSISLLTEIAAETIERRASAGETRGNAYPRLYPLLARAFGQAKPPSGERER